MLVCHIVVLTSKYILPYQENPNLDWRNGMINIPVREKERERERDVTPPTIHTAVNSVKLHWHLGVFDFILRLRLYKLNTLSLHSPATANSKMVCYVFLQLHYKGGMLASAIRIKLLFPKIFFSCSLVQKYQLQTSFLLRLILSQLCMKLKVFLVEVKLCACRVVTVDVAHFV